MILFLVMPGLFCGVGNYVVPIFQGSPEVVYPRVNNFPILIISLSVWFTRIQSVKTRALACRITSPSDFTSERGSSRISPRLTECCTIEGLCIIPHQTKHQNEIKDLIESLFYFPFESVAQ